MYFMLMFNNHYDNCILLVLLALISAAGNDGDEFGCALLSSIIYQLTCHVNS